MLHYLPGCDVRKNHKDSIMKITNYMKKQGVLIDNCCKDIPYVLNEEDVIIQNCTQCDLILNERFKNHKIISLYEYLLTQENFIFPNHEGETIVLQDCFRTRNNIQLQTTIRECLKKMNFTIIEMPENHQDTKFCGVWLNNEADSVCEKLAPQTFQSLEQYRKLLDKQTQKEKMIQWNQHYHYPVVVYCNGCEKGIKLGLKNPIHIIDLISEGL